MAMFGCLHEACLPSRLSCWLIHEVIPDWLKGLAACPSCEERKGWLGPVCNEGALSVHVCLCAAHSCLCLLSDQNTDSHAECAAASSGASRRSHGTIAFNVSVQGHRGQENSANSAVCCPSALNYQQETSFTEQEVMVSNWPAMIQ